ncbi:YihY/virulence factor BrkB family protein [Jeotgalibaca ciconiae]|uniref:YihY/virulence factor BrkB family protein n=1 Tax=Jeotgalibaca ciconiae TaxID=2496265 RepID=A0A3Q9BKA5_9LACT|nr:YihY/virulence factor BrkB family protein [Jeotgalibaca ciconiae]AZP03222.1 YihY/virulence factor BrkB family protein [Jeotgalibaca ciconiae]HJB24748.1 YihY/virulence factor BrkB family protein [Candidatus Jeotgalibaca pullicola]
MAAISKEKQKFDVRKAITIAMKQFKRAEMGRQSAELAYYILLALFPILLALGNIIPLLPIPAEQVLEYVEMGVPAEVGTVLLPILEDYLTGGSGGVVSIGLLISIWPASKAFTIFQRVLNQVYGVEERKNFIITRIFSFLITLLFVVLIGAVSFIFVFGREILNLIENFIPFDIVSVISTFEYFRWIVALVVLVVIMSFVYYMVPNVKWEFKYAIPGAILATIGFLLVSQLFSLYISFAGGQAIGNGAIGVFIVLMLWLYLIGNVFILGGILNVIIYDYTHENKIVIDEGETYLSVVYSEQAQKYLATKQILQKSLLKENAKIKMDHLPGQEDYSDWGR